MLRELWYIVYKLRFFYNTFVHFEEKNTSTTKQINNEKYFGQKPNKNPFPQYC